MLKFLSRLTAPIAGDSPFGADVNHDPDYERLKGEMGRLGDIDVSVVETLALKILTEKSKDTRAIVWLAYAMLKKNDIDRLADIFDVLADYCRDSFEQIFPRRETAKLAALRWLSEPRFMSRCGKANVSESDAPDIVRLKGALDRLRAALEKRFSSTGAPFPLALYRRVLEWEQVVEEFAQDGRNGGDDAADDDGKSGDNAPPPPAAVTEGDMSVRPATITLKLTHDEYREMLRCVNKVETLLKKFA
jgi:hypothetical protein